MTNFEIPQPDVRIAMQLDGSIVEHEEGHPFYSGASLRAYGDKRAREAVPEGWRLVPVEPTDEMIRAGDQKTWVLPSRDCWDAMLAAAPTPGEKT